jgi:two-component system chemotaxis response regulator CheB
VRRPAEDPAAVVALVASAGGLDAVSHVLVGLPADFDAAVVVLIHQAPDRTSRLVEILSGRCALAVASVEHGVALRAGHVVVVPPGQHALVTPGAGTVLISSGAAPPSRPSADLLLVTLATAAGSRAIAVILSGGGHDGATGAVAVHICGGIVLASDEASSTSYSMPLAAIQRDGAVDQIVPLDDIADRLRSLIASTAR